MNQKIQNFIKEHAVKKVLVTSGPVFGKLDDNKIFSNLARGKWAGRFATHMSDAGHAVTTLHNMEWRAYLAACTDLVKSADAAIMAAAVVNYVPEKPFEGKMPTDLDEVQVKLIRTPYIIDEMRKINPKCKLIGCKLTSREAKSSTIIKAQQLMDRSKSHAVIANDKDNLRLKMLCFPDGAVLHFEDQFEAMYEELRAMVEDVHFRTETSLYHQDIVGPCAIMDKLLRRYSISFAKPWAGKTKRFGSIAVRSPGGMFVTPRTKSKEDLTVEDCPHAVVDSLRVVTSGEKATLNAPLLWEVLQQHKEAAAVLHLHEFLRDDVPTLPYAPAGTVRDSVRGELPRKFNIQHHGFVACVDQNGHIL